jgi:hypothetical protein
MTVERKRASSKFQPTGCWIRTEKRLAIYLRDRFRCAYCGRDLHDARPADISLDHLECRVDGGQNHETNLVTACRSCNCSRADKAWTAFASARAARRIERQRWLDLAPCMVLARDLVAQKRAAAYGDDNSGYPDVGCPGGRVVGAVPRADAPITKGVARWRTW